MKKIITGLLMLVAVSAHAQHRHHHFHHPHMVRVDPYMWVLPTIVGGVVGYEIARQQHQQVVIQQSIPVVVQNQTCTPWTEVQNADGTITRTRTCTN